MGGLTDLTKRAQKFLDYAFTSAIKSNSTPSKTQNILIVTHWVFLRQMFTYLFKECRCKRAKTHELLTDEEFFKVLEKTCKNTSITTFTAKIDNKTNEILSAE